MPQKGDIFKQGLVSLFTVSEGVGRVTFGIVYTDIKWQQYLFSGVCLTNQEGC